MKLQEQENEEKENSEVEKIRNGLIQYWKQVSKNLNEEFEEILNLGLESEPMDIINALQILQESQEESNKADQNRIKE